MKTKQHQTATADCLFDETEALPLPDVAYIGTGEQVIYKRRNDLGQVVMSTPATVIGVSCRTQEVHLFVNPRLRFWVSVTSVSLVKDVAANQAAFAA